MIFRRTLVALAAAPMIVAAGVAPASAQTDAPASEVLRQQIQRRFEVLPLHNGLALRPKSPPSGARDVRSIELTDGMIALDGTPVTGAELRGKLGSDAELVLRLSYLDAAAQRAMFRPAEAPEAKKPEA